MLLVQANVQRYIKLTQVMPPQEEEKSQERRVLTISKYSNTVLLVQPQSMQH